MSSSIFTTSPNTDAGELAIAYEVLSLGGEGDQRLVTWLPADARTEAVFDSVVYS